MMMRKVALVLGCLLLLFICTTNAQKGNTYVKIETNLGAMIFSLAKETPKHNQNFIRLAKKGYFNKYTFNRVIKGFVIQGGETDSAYAEILKKDSSAVKYLAPEFNSNLIHQKGALAAGRDDNKEKKSFPGQFYVVDGKEYTDIQLDAVEKRFGKGFKFSEQARKIYKEIGGVPHLDQNYTIFGQLIKGWEVLDQISSTAKNKADQPLVAIPLKISVLNKKEVTQLGL
ncbi:MAG: peptidylprolyl isomerase [Flavobacterium sp.]|nr:MAG: peptidylprolyl isomerase [Flavobacterium sp.]